MTVFKLICIGIPLGLIIGIIIAAWRSGGRVRSFSVGPERAEEISQESTRSWDMFDD